MFFEEWLLYSPIPFLGPLFLLLKMVICLPPFILCFACVALTRYRSPRLKVMLLVPWLTMVMFVLKIWLVTMVLMLLLLIWAIKAA